MTTNKSDSTQVLASTVVTDTVCTHQRVPVTGNSKAPQYDTKITSKQSKLFESMDGKTLTQGNKGRVEREEITAWNYDDILKRLRKGTIMTNHPRKKQPMVEKQIWRV